MWGSYLAVVLTGCATKTIEVAPPELSVAPSAGPSVGVAYPLDARPAGQRRDGAYYSTSIPLPLITYGDINLRPGPSDTLYRSAQAGMTARGIPSPDSIPDYQVRLFVLEHAGISDVSDAQWVSTLSGGFTGTLGKFFYPAFVVVTARVRVQVLDDLGRTVVVRDVEALAVRRRTVARTWGVLSLFRRRVVPELFTEAFAEVHHQLALDIAAVADDARHGRLPSVGQPPTQPVFTALQSGWRRADTLTPVNEETDVVAKKYGSHRFSLLTGHDTVRGEAVGQLGIPLETFGYELGVTDTFQAQIDLTLLIVAPYLERLVPLLDQGIDDAGLFTGLTTGGRLQLWCGGASCVSASAYGGLDTAFLQDQSYRPQVAALRTGAGLMYSVRPGDVTLFAGTGPSLTRGLKSFQAFTDGDLRELRIAAGPGAELQLTQTVLLAARVDASIPLESSSFDVSAIEWLPQLYLGLR